jgi:hypothetical protein
MTSEQRHPHNFGGEDGRCKVYDGSRRKSKSQNLENIYQWSDWGENEVPGLLTSG